MDHTGNWWDSSTLLHSTGHRCDSSTLLHFTGHRWDSSTLLHFTAFITTYHCHIKLPYLGGRGCPPGPILVVSMFCRAALVFVGCCCCCCCCCNILCCCRAILPGGMAAPPCCCCTAWPTMPPCCCTMPTPWPAMGAAPSAPTTPPPSTTCWRCIWSLCRCWICWGVLGTWARAGWGSPDQALAPPAPGLGILLGDTWPGDREPIWCRGLPGWGLCWGPPMAPHCWPAMPGMLPACDTGWPWPGIMPWPAIVGCCCCMPVPGL